MTQLTRFRGNKWLLMILCTLMLLVPAPVMWAQDTEASRKVLHRVIPEYPELARRMGTAGTVRLVAVVAPNGTVKQVEVLGGHPLLVRAAQDAVTRWKYASAPQESKEVIELRFQPQ